jgi:transcriptional regulator with AAA-type ATPase domain
MITENKINDIIDYKIRVNKNFVPRSANKLLPPFFYSALFIGSTGTGKTFAAHALQIATEAADITPSPTSVNSSTKDDNPFRD